MNTCSPHRLLSPSAVSALLLAACLAPSLAQQLTYVNLFVNLELNPAGTSPNAANFFTPNEGINYGTFGPVHHYPIEIVSAKQSDPPYPPTADCSVLPSAYTTFAYATPASANNTAASAPSFNPPAPHRAVSFAVAAPTGAPGSPQIDYWVDGAVHLANGRKFYLPATFGSGPLPPNTPKTFTHTEPVGLIHVKLTCNGNPLKAHAGYPYVTAGIDTPGSSFQANCPQHMPYYGSDASAGPLDSKGVVQAGVAYQQGDYIEESFLVRAGNSYIVTVNYYTDSLDGPMSGGFTSPPTGTIAPGQKVDLEAAVDPVFCDNGTDRPQAAYGILALGGPQGVNLFETMGVNAGYAPVAEAVLGRASGGSRKGYASPNPGFPNANPANYEIRNPLPDYYGINAEMYFFTGNYSQLERFRIALAFPDPLPGTGYSTLPPGYVDQTQINLDCLAPINLSHLLDLTAGQVTGKITLIGPATASWATYLSGIRIAASGPAALVQDSGFDYTAHTTFSYLRALGGMTPTRSSGNWNRPGYADVTIAGQSSGYEFHGSYDLRLAGLATPDATDATTVTPFYVGGANAGYVALMFSNPAIPTQHPADEMTLNDILPEVGVIPGATTTKDISRCMGEVIVTLVPPSFPTFLWMSEPWIQATATSDSTGLATHGDPSQTTAPVTLDFFLPEGTYTVSPKAKIHDSAIPVDSQVTFPGWINVQTPCKGTVNLTSEPGIGASPLITLSTGPDPCTTSATSTFSATVTPPVDTQGHSLPLDEVSYTVNGQKTTVCTSCGTSPVTFTATIPLNLCDNTLTITAKDSSGTLVSSVTYHIHRYSTPPVIHCPPDANVPCGQPYDTSALGVATVTSDCPATISHIDTYPASCVIKRTWTAKDDCSQVSCDQLITIGPDTTPPIVTSAAGAMDANLPCNDPQAIATAMDPGLAPSVVNACGPIIGTNLVSVPLWDSTCPGAYVLVRTWTFTNVCGLVSAPYVQTTTVQNNIAPTITNCPPDITVDCTSDAGAVVTYPIVGAVNPCSGLVLVTCVPPPGHLFPIGTTLVTCTAHGCGNATATSTFKVTVRPHTSKWTWARQTGIDNADLIQTAVGNAVAVDSSGNVYVTGSFQDNLVFLAPGTPTVLQSLQGFGQQDIFLAKYNSSGDFQWAVRAGGPGADVGNGVTVDTAGNVYLTGAFRGTATFYSYVGPYTDTPFPTTLTALGGADAFVAMYNSSGVCQWVSRDGGAGDDYGAGIACAGTQLFVAGVWGAGSGPAPREQALLLPVTTAGIVGARVLSAPVPLYQSTQYAKGRAIAVDTAGKLYITGVYGGGATTLPGNTPPTLPATPLSAGLWVAKYDPTGPGYLWATHGGYFGTPQPTGYSDGTGIGVDPSGLYCYATAYFNGTANFPNGSPNGLSVPRLGALNDYLIVKLDTTTGLPAWVTAGGTATADDGETRALVVASDGHPSITGFVQPGAFNSGVNAGPTVIARSYDQATGNLRWNTDALNDPSVGGAPQDVGLGIAAGPTGCIHVTGGFTRNLTFPPANLPVATLVATPPDQTDLFVAKARPACCPANPVLHYTLTGSTILLSWDSPCCVLQASPEVGPGATWTTVPASSPVTLQLATAHGFFRLLCP